MEVPKKLLNVIVNLMEGWKNRLEVNKDGKVLKSRKTNIRKGFFQGDKLTLPFSNPQSLLYVS